MTTDGSQWFPDTSALENNTGVTNHAKSSFKEFNLEDIPQRNF